MPFNDSETLPSTRLSPCIMISFPYLIPWVIGPYFDMNISSELGFKLGYNLPKKSQFELC